jgi:hypothetical protein
MTLPTYIAALVITIIMSASATAALLCLVYFFGRMLEKRQAERSRPIVRLMIVTHDETPTWSRVCSAGIPAFTAALIGAGIPMSDTSGGRGVIAPVTPVTHAAAPTVVAHFA